MDFTRIFTAIRISPAKTTKFVLTTGMVAAVAFSNPVISASLGHDATAAERGQEIAFTRKLGNCLACHVIPGGVSGGNIAPPLMAMKGRFPDKAKLRDQIWDPRVANPDTSMLPFGAHKILTEKQINDLVEYLYTL